MTGIDRIEQSVMIDKILPGPPSPNLEELFLRKMIRRPERLQLGALLWSYLSHLTGGTT